MKIVSKKLIVILSICFTILLIGTIRVHGASLSISTSKSQVSPGESFTVTVSASNGAGSVSASVSNGSGSLGSTWLDNSSASFTCTAGSSGSVSISASGVLADYTTEKDENKSASKSVTIVVPTPEPKQEPKPESKPENNTSTQKPVSKPTQQPKQEVKKSSDSKLKSMTINEGEFPIEFSSDATEYHFDIPNDITELNILAETNDSKASYNVTGNTEFIIGENIITVTVTAEDGSVTNYKVIVNRLNPPLALKTLRLTYEDEEGTIKELVLSPEFKFDALEYTTDMIPYYVSKIKVEALANLEKAEIKIEGNEEIIAGENIITITATIPEEINEETGEIIKEEEKIVYTIKAEREPDPIPPTIWEKIGGWFNGVFGGVANWYNNNSNQVNTYALIVATVALIVFIAFFIKYYKKYKEVVHKINQLTELNINTNNNVTENESATIDEVSNKKLGRHS